MDPNPDYDASDEIEYGFNWWAWILRGVLSTTGLSPGLSLSIMRPRLDGRLGR